MNRTTQRNALLGLLFVVASVVVALTGCGASRTETVRSLPAIVDFGCAVVNAYPHSSPALERAKELCGAWTKRDGVSPDKVLDAIEACELERRARFKPASEFH